MTKNLCEIVVSRVKYAWFENIGVWFSNKKKILGYGILQFKYGVWIWGIQENHGVWFFEKINLKKKYFKIQNWDITILSEALSEIPTTLIFGYMLLEGNCSSINLCER